MITPQDADAPEQQIERDSSARYFAEQLVALLVDADEFATVPEDVDDWIERRSADAAEYVERALRDRLRWAR